MSDLETITAKLDDIDAIIATAQTDLQSGKVKGLAHIDGAVARICEEAVKLPPDDAKKVQPMLANLIGNLDTLALSLQSFQNEMKEKLR